MRQTIFLLPAFVLLMAVPAFAQEKIEYYQDPVYEKINKDDEHPMDDMIKLADGGDVRAQFILGDLYSKGQGGLPRNTQKARQWFETAARNKYGFSFIRLAALEKRVSKPVDAYKWYTLGIDSLRGDDRKYAAGARDKLVADAHLTKEQLREGRLAADDWKKKTADAEKAAKAAAALDAAAQKKIAQQEKKQP